MKINVLASAALFLCAASVPSWADQNVMDHGAKCNGKFDDTAAFKAAIAAADVNGTVFVPVGQCVLSDTLVVTASHPVSFRGKGIGSQIFESSNKTLLQYVGAIGISITGLFLGSAATSPGTSLLELDYSNHDQIQNIDMLGSYYGLHLYGSLGTDVINLSSAINYRNEFFAVASIPSNGNANPSPGTFSQYWVYAEPSYTGPYAPISANANTFINPILEGGTNGIFLTDNEAQGSIHVLGGTVEGVSGTAVTFQGSALNSSISGVHFESNGIDIVSQAAQNIQISSIVSVTPGQINLMGDTRNVLIENSIANNIYLDLGDSVYPAGASGPGTGTGVKRIILQNITTCVAQPSIITPTPTGDPYFGGAPNGPSSPVIPNPAEANQPRKDILYTNIGVYCGGG